MNRRDEAPRRIDQPRPGHFLLRLVKGGPMVAASIAHVDGIWTATIDGVLQEPSAADWTRAAGVERIWTGGILCSAAEHDYRLQLAEWARVHDPDSPAANPNRPIRLTNLPPIF